MVAQIGPVQFAMRQAGGAAMRLGANDDVKALIGPCADGNLPFHGHDGDARIV